MTMTNIYPCLMNKISSINYEGNVKSEKIARKRGNRQEMEATSLTSTPSGTIIFTSLRRGSDGNPSGSLHARKTAVFPLHCKSSFRSWFSAMASASFLSRASFAWLPIPQIISGSTVDAKVSNNHNTFLGQWCLQSTFRQSRCSTVICARAFLIASSE